jgi:hypothetical protein
LREPDPPAAHPIGRGLARGLPGCALANWACGAATRWRFVIQRRMGVVLRRSDCMRPKSEVARRDRSAGGRDLVEQSLGDVGHQDLIRTPPQAPAGRPLAPSTSARPWVSRPPLTDLGAWVSQERADVVHAYARRLSSHAACWWRSCLSSGRRADYGR